MQSNWRTLLGVRWPLAIAGAVSAFFVACLFGYVKWQNSVLPKPVGYVTFHEQVDHPVTSEMRQAAKQLGGTPAPAFDGVGLTGARLSLASLTKDKPLVLFFVELHCPCCKGAKPYIDRIETYYGDVCNVLGVIDAPPDLAKAWANTTGPQFDVMADPDMHTIRAFKALRGVYTTLIAPGGRIVKAYPGYSRDMLRELSRMIARLSGVKERPMPLDPAPTRMSSGCLFPGTKLPGDEL